MPIYEFRCASCGVFDSTHRMGQAPPAVACPSCGASSRRGFAAAGLSRANSASARTIDAAARSAETPEVVRSVPRGGSVTPRTTGDPRHLKLPRP